MGGVREKLGPDGLDARDCRGVHNCPVSSSDPRSAEGWGEVDSVPVQAQATGQERSPWADGHSRGEGGKGTTLSKAGPRNRVMGSCPQWGGESLG